MSAHQDNAEPFAWFVLDSSDYPVISMSEQGAKNLSMRPGWSKPHPLFRTQPTSALDFSDDEIKAAWDTSNHEERWGHFKKTMRNLLKARGVQALPTSALVDELAELANSWMAFTDGCREHPAKKAFQQTAVELRSILAKHRGEK